MWHTLRKLRRRERDLLTRTVCTMRNEIMSGEAGDEDVLDLQTGVPIFERMTCGEKVYALSIVLVSVLEDAPAQGCSKNAWTESTIYAIFKYIGRNIDYEIAHSLFTGVTHNVHRTALVGFARGKNHHRMLRSEWPAVVEEAADKILWDRDFENEDHFSDMEPDAARMHKTNLGIDPDYFATPVPFVSASDAKKACNLIGLMAGHSAVEIR